MKIKLCKLDIVLSGISLYFHTSNTCHCHRHLLGIVKEKIIIFIIITSGSFEIWQRKFIDIIIKLFKFHDLRE